MKSNALHGDINVRSTPRYIHKLVCLITAQTMSIT